MSNDKLKGTEDQKADSKNEFEFKQRGGLNFKSVQTADDSFGKFK